MAWMMMGRLCVRRSGVERRCRRHGIDRTAIQYSAEAILHRQEGGMPCLGRVRSLVAECRPAAAVKTGMRRKDWRTDWKDERTVAFMNRAFSLRDVFFLSEQKQTPNKDRLPIRAPHFSEKLVKDLRRLSFRPRKGHLYHLLLFRQDCSFIRHISALSSVPNWQQIPFSSQPL